MDESKTVKGRALSFGTVDAYGTMYSPDMKIGAGIGFDATKWHVDENGVTVIEEARLHSIGIVPYTPGDERYGVYPIQRGVEPVDAGLDLPPLPVSYKPTDAELQKAVNSWDANMGDKAGLLDAEAVDE